MKINDINFMVGGIAGEGVEVPGEFFAKLCIQAGLYVHTNGEFHSVIKGYNNIFQVRAREERVLSHSNDFDLVLALDKETVDKYLDNVTQGGGIIYDPEMAKPAEKKGIKLFPVPLRLIAKEKVGLDLAKNIVGIGAVAGLLDYPMQSITDMLVKTFARKGLDVVNKNIDAAQAGYNYVRENFPKEFDYVIRQKKDTPKTMMVNGNDAIGMGAIKAGCKFVSEYPMTPSSSILHFMAKYAQKYNMSVNHVEDEISAINMAIGAGYAGVRSMTATSGGGFSLMTEAIGLAGMTEVPVVIAEVQRPGPSTGLPTRSGQGDLRQVLHASQGDYPKIVMSPGTHEEAFYMAFHAFNLAEKYQCPVIILSEKYLCEGRASFEFPKTEQLRIDRGKLLKESEIPANFKRFAQSPDGVCARTIPGQKGGAHTASSYEHREDGYFTEIVSEVVDMNNRRMQKMETIATKLPHAEVEGKAKADVTLVCWGATYGPAHEAIALLKEKGVTANLLHIKYLMPFQPGVREAIEHCKHPVLIEGNFSAQLGGLIAEKAGVEISDKVLDYSGRPFTPDIISARISNILNHIDIK